MLQGSGNQFGAIPSERFADRPPERMCRDLRSMQLFAEQVLAHRLSKDPTLFRSYGFHEPNTEEGRQVYTVVDEQLYYFLPKLSVEAVHRTLRQIPALVHQEQRFGPPIQQVVIVGESSTVNDRDRLQEAVDNYQPARLDSRLSAPILPESQSAAWPTTNLLASSLGTVGDAAMPDAPIVPTPPTAATPPLTAFPTAAPQPLPLKLRLSYINEDSYWDPRQDDLTVQPEGLMHDRASQITAWLQKHPSTANFDLDPVATPIGTTLQSPSTQLQSPDPINDSDPTNTSNPTNTSAPTNTSDPTNTSVSARETPIEPSVTVPETQVNRGDRRSSDWFKTGPLANAWPLLTLLGSLGLLLGLAQWGRNQLVNTAANDIAGSDAPPTGQAFVDSTTANNRSTRRTNTPTNSTNASGTSNFSTANGTGSTRTVLVNGTTAAQPQLPPVGFWVQAAQPHDGVNLRTGPGTENRKIRGIPNGYWLVDEGRTIGNWREVSFQGQRGWVYRPFIR
ncbi:MAG: hypothetical protein RLZZ511_4053 [Cyanobacteriota bacterium]